MLLGFCVLQVSNETATGKNLLHPVVFCKPYSLCALREGKSRVYIRLRTALPFSAEYVARVKKTKKKNVSAPRVTLVVSTEKGSTEKFDLAQLREFYASNPNFAGTETSIEIECRGRT